MKKIKEEKEELEDEFEEKIENIENEQQKQYKLLERKFEKEKNYMSKKIALNLMKSRIS